MIGAFQSWRQLDCGKLSRWLGLILVTALGLLAWGRFTWMQASPVTVSFLVSAIEAQQLQALVDDFEVHHPDIHIDMVQGPNATDVIESLYTTSFLLGDSPYDIVYADLVWIPKFAAAGWLLDLSDRISEADLDQFLQADVAAARYQGGLYRIPFRSDMGMLYYRTDLLDQVGMAPPETFADLIAASNAIQAQTDVPWGYVWQGLQYEGLVTNFVEIVAGYGGFWINADTLEVGLDRPEAIQATEFMRGLIQDGISPPGVTTYLEVDSQRVFQNGQAAFLRNWGYVWADANQEGSPIRGKIALKPMVHAPGQPAASCLGAFGFGISASSPRPDAAWTVVDFFTSQPVQKKLVLASGYVPSRRELFNDPEILAKYPQYQQLFKVAKTTLPRPPVGQYAQLSDILQRYLSAALSGQLSPEQAMQAAAEETRLVLGQREGQQQMELQ